MKKSSRWPRRILSIVPLLILLVLAGLHVMESRLQQSKLDELLERRWIAAGKNLSVSYFSTGDPALGRIVYVHGSPGSAGAWDRYLIDPVLGLESVSLDRPGFGQTEPEEPQAALSVQSSAIEPFLEPMGGIKPVLVGHSIGGPVVVRAAVDYPDRVGAIIVVAGSIDPDQERMRWFNDLASAPIIRSIIPRSLYHSNEEIVPLEAELEVMKPLLDELECPVYIIHGTEDSLVPYANVAYMQTMFGDRIALMDIIENGDHFLPWEEEERVRDLIRQAVEDLKTSSK